MEIMSLPGIGPKKAAMLRERLGVTNLEELARAAREKRVRTLPGMGSKTESEIIRNIEMRESLEVVYYWPPPGSWRQRWAATSRGSRG